MQTEKYLASDIASNARRPKPMLVRAVFCGLTLASLFSGVAGAEELSPGLWEISVESRIAGMDFMRPIPSQSRQCLSPEDAKDPTKLVSSISTPGAKNCTYTDKNYSKSGGTFTFAMSCAGSYDLRTQGEVNFTATTLDGDITATGTLSGQPAQLLNHVSARRVGSC